MTAEPARAFQRLTGRRPLVVQVIDSLVDSDRTLAVLQALGSSPRSIDSLVLAGGDRFISGDGWSSPLLAGGRAQIVPSLHQKGSLVEDGRAFLWLTQWLRVIRPDVVHTHGLRFGYLGRLAAVRSGRPLVHTAHEWGSPRMERALGQHCHRLIVTSTGLLDEACEGGYVAQDRLRLLPIATPKPPAPPAEHTRRQSRARFGLGRQFTVGVDASLGADNDLDMALSAARLVVDALESGGKDFGFLLLLVGRGPDRHRLEGRIDNLGLRRYVRIDADHDPLDLTPCFDLALGLSLIDNLSPAIRRAASAAIPIIATKRGAIDELVEDGVSGVLIEAGDASALSDAVLRAMRSPEEFKRYGDRAFAAADALHLATRQADLASVWMEAWADATGTDLSAEEPDEGDIEAGAAERELALG